MPKLPAAADRWFALSRFRADPWVVVGPAILFAVTLTCYWRPMTSNGTTILWDAADQFQPIQNYLSREIHEGRIPFWSPYPLAGYPFLADPQLGAWYPINWPFFLVGVTPRGLVTEHFVHAFWASLGAYFFGLRLIRYAPGAVLAGLSYGLSGFFVGHSSHTPQLGAAAWTPWLLLLLDRALEAHAVRHTVLGGLAAGMMILAGHFQTALYSFLALALFAAARAFPDRRLMVRAGASALGMAIIGTMISAIGTGPGLELAAYSTRASLNALERAEGLLELPALMTLVVPNYYGVMSGVASYRGPADITQYYFYAGFALIPLAMVGSSRRAIRWIVLPLLIIPIWYALGHSAGLYLLLARLPGFASIRGPVNIWFVPALALALLAGAGLAAIAQPRARYWLPVAVLLATVVDVAYRNSFTNPLAYARVSYDERYGGNEEMFRLTIVSGLPPLTRFDAPPNTTAFGSLSHYLNVRVETTYGYVPMPLAAYVTYVEAMGSNALLRNALGVSRWLDPATRTIRQNPDALPRAYFPKELVTIRTAEESARRLLTLDPGRQALVPPHVQIAAQDSSGIAEVSEHAPGYYKIRYTCRSPSVVRVATAWFPGWTARVREERLDVFPIDHALVGVIVPAGDGEVELTYRSTYFVASAAVTLIALASCLTLLFIGGRSGRTPR